MRKVYESIDFNRVGHFKSILDGADIACEIRNTGAQGLAGEIPFTETFPELWVVHDSDYDLAINTLETYRDGSRTAENAEPWNCPKCAEALEGQFSECWNCGTPRPATGVELEK